MAEINPNNGINYQPQLVSRISSINSLNGVPGSRGTALCQPTERSNRLDLGL